ncbi:MAG: hypothetical protein CVV32_11045 [Methanomicrobiales archaeon HGW-Methanomicrobiales-3]|jgi:PAS domain S-box-containing protein|nr:MAG: hypothetical protein CVV32_11045 [Methanomicrobiales archaeon HGW-Methanomicrobiales-3]
MPPAGVPPDKPPYGLIVAMLLLFLAILLGGALLYQAQEEQITSQVTRDLTGIASLKAGQIAAWREDRLFDARVLSSSPFLIEGVDEYLRDGDMESREKILGRFREMNTSSHYQNVILVDPDGEVRLSLDPGVATITPDVRGKVAESVMTRAPLLTDFHRFFQTGQIHTSVIAPLMLDRDGQKIPVGAVILSIDPEEFLYPYIQTWPVPSETAETLLVMREGDHVLFLNDLRHQPGSALNLTIPLTQSEVPAVMAVLGTTGTFSGKDYRGTDVISVLEPIPGSPWFMVAKVDTAEAYATWRTRSGLIIALVIGTLAGAIVVTGLLWQRRQKYYYRSLFAAEASRREYEEQDRERMGVLLRLYEMESATEQELADFVLEAAGRMTRSPLAFLGVMTPDESVFEITAWSKSVMKDCSVAAAPLHFPVARAGIWAEAVRQRKPQVVNDYAAPIPGKKGLPPGHVPVSRFVSVPIFDGAQIVMVCAVANKDADYTQADVDNLTLLMQGVWNHIRKRTADTALRESEARLIMAQEIGHVGGWEYDLATGTIWGSAEAARIYGLPPVAGEFPIDQIEACIGERERVHQALVDLIADGREYNLEFAINPVDGTPQKMILSIARLKKDAGGNPLKVVGVIQDITQRRTAEDALRETNDYLQNLFNYANVPIIVWDPQFRITRFNHAFERLTGRSEAEVLGSPLALLFPEESRASSLNQIQRTVAGERWETVEIPILTVSGEVRIVLWNSATIYALDTTTMVATIAQGQDITDRKMAEDAVRKSEEKYRELFVNVTAAFALHEIICDDAGIPVDYRFLMVNPAFEAMTGLSAADIINRAVLEVLPGTEPYWIETYGRVALSGQPELFENFSRDLKKWYEVRAYRPKQGQFATVFTDITDRKDMEMQREKLIAELELKNAELERFTYTVSHDLKSPLITIKGFAGLLEGDAQNDDPLLLKNDVSRIITAADTMQALLSDLLELARVGKISNPPQKMAFGTIAREAVDLLAMPLAERGVTVEIAPDLPDVFVDHARIREVMINLIENAAKFSGAQEHPVIRIGAEQGGADPVFFVADNGIGINPRYLDRIFNLFERLDVTAPGTGIGLPIVRKIIEAHGGRIWAESEGEGKGAVFRFTLPGAGSSGEREDATHAD